MSRRLTAYLVFMGCMALICFSAAGTDDRNGLLIPNLDTVVHAYSQQSYLDVIDSSSNTIIDDANSLEPFMKKLLRLRSGAQEVVSVVHIGDSHVQAGFWDARLRELFQADFGDAGRGLIIPYKLAGSNEPRDYAITTSDKLVSGKAISRSLVEKLGFTGVAVGVEAVEPVIKIWSKSPFNTVTVFHHDKAPLFSEPDTLAIGSYCTLANSDRSTRINLNKDVETLSLRGQLTEDYNNPTVYGFSLENGKPGVLVHSIGVNSAAFEHFERNTDFVDGGAQELTPDLIVISLGTNNCFGYNYRNDDFRDISERFVKKVRESYPGSAILLTTPMEGCRRSRRTYVVNNNVADVADVLTSVARDNGVAAWDFYTAATGQGGSRVWYGRQLMQSDRLHLTEEGYSLQAEMLYDALMRSYNGYIRHLVQDEKTQIEIIATPGVNAPATI